MNKRFLFFLPSLLLMLLLAASCGENRPAQSRCEVSVVSEFPEYDHGYLRLQTGQRLDTLVLTDGRLTFERTDTAAMPYIAFIHLENREDSADCLDMPVAIESGRVEVTLGEYIETKGTPLNTAIQEFLNDLQALSTSIRQRKDITVEEVERLYSSFYRQQILTNRDNPLGDFILKNYGVHLKGEDVVSF